jgi:peroxiredoxin Q/BCP
MELNIGDKAPDFKAKDQDGKEIKLSDFKGKKVVLYFYPKDNTPGCTAQACNLRDNYEELQKQGYVVLGVSQDSEKSHQKFIEKQNLPFPLIADEDHTVHNLYGTWGEKKMYGKTYMGTLRTTFVIDGDGKIEDIIQKVKTKEHTAQILNS